MKTQIDKPLSTSKSLDSVYAFQKSTEAKISSASVASDSPNQSNETRAGKRTQLLANQFAEIVRRVWARYYDNMDNGMMRQRPGTHEYLGEFQRAGLVERGDKATNQFWFDVFWNKESHIRKAILKAQKQSERSATSD